MFINKIKLLLLLGVLSFTMILSGGCKRLTSSQDQQSQFDEFIYDLFVEDVQSDTISLNYTLSRPEDYGIKRTKATLGEFSASTMKDAVGYTKERLKDLQSFDFNKLTPDQQLTYDILKYYMEQELELGNYIYYTESLGPTTGLQAQLPILLAEYNFYDKDDIDSYLELLPCVYDYFEDIAEFEREKSKQGLFMTDAVADRIIEQAEAFISVPEDNLLIEYFDEKVDSFNDLSQKELDNYKKQNLQGVQEYIIPSYELLIDVLQELKGTGVNNGGLYHFPDGKAYYEALAKFKTGSDKSMTELIDLLDTSIADGILAITKLAVAEQSLIEKFDGFSGFPLTDPEDILGDLKQAILVDFPEPVDVNCDIKYVHESLSDYLSPAMYLVPAIDNYTNNNIYINGNDSDTLSTIYTTVAHEGYPGHLYQNVYFKSQNPAPIRNILDFIGYAEGWATYVEYYSYELSGIDKDLASLFRINNELILMMYARADIGIHYEGWDKSYAVTYINGFAGDEDISTEIYETLLEEPAVYLPYAVGYLEILELRDIAEKAQGENFNPKDFHKFLLDIGPAQFSIIEDNIMLWLDNDTSR